MRCYLLYAGFCNITGLMQIEDLIHKPEKLSCELDSFNSDLSCFYPRTASTFGWLFR